MVMVEYNGIMVINMKENLKIIIYMEKDVLNGKIIVNMKENIIMMLNKDMVYIIGKIIKNIKECGKMVNGMEKVN